MCPQACEVSSTPNLSPQSLVVSQAMEGTTGKKTPTEGTIRWLDLLEAIHLVDEGKPSGPLGGANDIENKELSHPEFIARQWIYII